MWAPVMWIQRAPLQRFRKKSLERNGDAIGKQRHPNGQGTAQQQAAYVLRKALTDAVQLFVQMSAMDYSQGPYHQHFQ